MTPGLSQVQLAADLFRNAAPSIVDDPTAFANLVREKVAFAGSMRTNLCGMLDKLNLPAHFGAEKSADLFAQSRPDVAPTSALVYPVFTGPDNKNFGGTADLAKSALFREMLDMLLLPRMLASPRSFLIPLGDAASSGIRYLVQSHGLDPRRVLFGLPHPSGGNGHRVKQFSERRFDLEERLRSWFSTSASYTLI